jgi:hypothetical protein
VLNSGALCPVISNGYERQFVYKGQLEWMLCREMNTMRMGEFRFQTLTVNQSDGGGAVESLMRNSARSLIMPSSP